jgi:hypothetical protein
MLDGIKLNFKQKLIFENIYIFFFFLKNKNFFLGGGGGVKTKFFVIL